MGQNRVDKPIYQQGSVESFTTRQSGLVLPELAENAEVAFFTASPELETIRYASPAFESVFRCPKRSIRAPSGALLQLVHPDDHARVQHCLSREHPGTVTVRLRSAELEERWLRLELTAVSDEQGQRTAMVGTASDVTPSLHLDSSLQECTRRFAALTRLSTVGLWHLSPQGSTEFASASLCRVLGVSSMAQLAHYHPRDFVGEDAADAIFAERSPTHATQRRCVVRSLRGGEHTALVESVPLLDATEAICGHIAAFTLTPPARTSASSSRLSDTAESVLQPLLLALATSESSSDIVAALENHGTAALDCDAFCWVEAIADSGRCRAESSIRPHLRGHNAPWQQWISSISATSGVPVVIEDLQADSPLAAAHELYADVRSALVACFPGHELQGALEAHWYSRHVATAHQIDRIAAIATATALAVENISLRKRVERASQPPNSRDWAAQHDAELAERLRHAEKMDVVGQLAGGVAHDFNNLLAPMLAYSDWLARQAEFPEKFRIDLNAVLEAAHRAKALVQQLLTFGRKQLREIKPLDVSAEIRVLERMLRRVIHEDVQMRFSLTDEPCHVLADRTQFQQVLMNLAVNAQDAMPSGGTLLIKTERLARSDEPSMNAGKSVKLTVSDTGTGMSEAILQRIFEPFYTTKRPGHGTGLGLATVRSIVEEQGGVIQCSSAPQEGTIFRIWLPISEAWPEATPPPPKLVQGAGECVLVVEDDAMVRDLARRILERGGYRILVAANLAEAHTRVTENEGRVDLLVSDLILPHANGRQVYEELSSKLRNLRVLYMSGYAPDVLETRTALEAGVTLLKKPFGVDQLLEAVRVALDKTS